MVFIFTPETKGRNHVVVCVRIEGCKGSSEAVKLSGRHVVPALLHMGYIKSFETAPRDGIPKAD